MAIQGFGNVSSHAAKFLHEADFRVVAVSNSRSAYYRREGLDIPHLLHYVLGNNNRLDGYPNAERMDNKQLLELDVDLLIPGALDRVITLDNVDRIKAPIIIEAANGPIDPEADQKLFERDVIVLPDILANAGGVTVSYFEWVQNLQYYKWNLNRVRQELDHVLTSAFEQVWEEAQARNVSLRTAAYIIAIGRVHRATLLAGIS